MKRGKTEIHYFCCPNCGAITPLPRKLSKQYEKFHRKRLYCYNCKQELNQIECRNQTEVYEFQENFKAGEYINETKNSIYFVGDTGIR